ncbi:MAG: hypothetical protein K0Q50_1341 [Vampirovibrio sp.]|jgi:Tfp pilus assembly protein PilV|nr:hypothetical protein [Vampirovibrio sp.]
MALLLSNKPANPALSRKRQAGLSLLEIGIGMMLLAILSVGVSSLVRTGVENQMSERAHQEMQSIGLNIVDDIRLDIRKADIVTVPNSSTLSLVMDAAANQTVTYQLESGGKFSRSETGKAKKYYNFDTASNSYWNRMQVTCPDTPGCFSAESLNTENKPRQIRLPNLRVVQQLPNGNQGSLIDQHFGPANFTVKDFSFDVPSATVFQ